MRLSKLVDPQQARDTLHADAGDPGGTEACLDLEGPQEGFRSPWRRGFFGWE